MEPFTPPLPPPLRRRAIVRCRYAGLRDRFTRVPTADRHTPWTRRLLAECQAGELAVLDALVRHCHTLEVSAAVSLMPAVVNGPVGPAPRGVPEDAWEARKALAVRRAADVVAGQEATNAQLAEQARTARESATAAAMVAVGEWATRFEALLMAYTRAQLGRVRDLSGWLPPTYIHLAGFHHAPLLVGDVDLHLTTSLKEETDVPA